MIVNFLKVSVHFYPCKCFSRPNYSLIPSSPIFTFDKTLSEIWFDKLRKKSLYSHCSEIKALIHIMRDMPMSGRFLPLPNSSWIHLGLVFSYKVQQVIRERQSDTIANTNGKMTGSSTPFAPQIFVSLESHLSSVVSWQVGRRSETHSMLFCW